MRGWIDGRQWIAALCVALIAFLTIGHASSECAKSIEKAGAAYTISYSDAADPQSPMDPAAPLVAQADHCCAAHASVLPPTIPTAVSLRMSLSVIAARDTDDAPVATPQGLDRPPRTTASA